MTEHRITTLDSGVRVVTERMPDVRSVAVGCWIATGAALERSEQAGISHLLEHMLFRGTESYRSEEIDQIFDAMGTELDAETDKESTALLTRVLDRHLERAFDVMAQMVWRPALESLEAEREVVLEEIAMYEDDPQERVFDVLGEAIFGSHPLGRAVIGEAATVGAIDEDALRAYHGERYVAPNVVIAAAGAVEHEALLELVSAAGASAGQGAQETPVLGPPTPRVRFMPKRTEQYHVCLGAPGIARHDERRFALRVLDNIFGATASSRLFQEVRERRGLAYSVFSFANLYSATGEVGMYVGTRPENLAESLEAIVAEIERLLAQPPSADELERARENVKGRMVLALESTGARMGRLGGSLLAGLPILSLDEVIERIDAVSVDELRELTCELYDPARLSVAAIGPDQDAFEAALAPLRAAGMSGAPEGAAAQAGAAKGGS